MPTKEKVDNRIRLNINEMFQAFTVLNDLLNANPDPFNGQAKGVLYKLQREIQFWNEMKAEDREGFKDVKVDVGIDKIVSPGSFPNEYEPILKLLCHNVTKPQSIFEKLLQEQKNKKEKSE